MVREFCENVENHENINFRDKNFTSALGEITTYLVIITYLSLSSDNILVQATWPAKKTVRLVCAIVSVNKVAFAPGNVTIYVARQLQFNRLRKKIPRSFNWVSVI